jgi:hypothetical protein
VESPGAFVEAFPTPHNTEEHANQVVVAIAQEMAAFIWAIAHEVPKAR